MPQLNINCPKCHRFVKIISGKQVSSSVGKVPENTIQVKKTRFISECGHCNIKILSSIEGDITIVEGKSIYNGTIATSINEPINDKTFEKYKKQFQEKPKKITYEEKYTLVENHIFSSKFVQKKQQIAKSLNLPISVVSKICRQLRKEKKIVLAISGKRFKEFKREEFSNQKLSNYNVYVIPKKVLQVKQDEQVIQAS